MYTHKESARFIKTRVVGVSFNNRQGIVSNLQPGEKVLLVREPENQFDPHAVKVTRQDGQQFGYLDRYLAARISPQLDHYGKPIKAIVASLTGGFYRDSNFGVIVEFDLPE